MQRLLKDASPEIMARIEANLSARMFGMVTDEVAYMGTIRPRDIAEVQGKIAQQARKLHRIGEITL